MIRLELTEEEAGLVEAMALREFALCCQFHDQRAADAERADQDGYHAAARRWRLLAEHDAGMGQIVDGLLVKLRTAEGATP